MTELRAPDSRLAWRRASYTPADVGPLARLVRIEYPWRGWEQRSSGPVCTGSRWSPA